MNTTDRISTPRYEDIAEGAAAMILQESQSFVGPVDQRQSQPPQSGKAKPCGSPTAAPGCACAPARSPRTDLI